MTRGPVGASRESIAAGAPRREGVGEVEDDVHRLGVRARLQRPGDVDQPHVHGVLDGRLRTAGIAEQPEQRVVDGQVADVDAADQVMAQQRAPQEGGGIRVDVPDLADVEVAGRDRLGEGD